MGAIIVSSLLRAFVGQMFIIPSDSMQNTLLQGDRVVVQKVTDFHRGNVVVFKDPADWLGDEPTETPTALDRVLEFVGVPTSTLPGPPDQARDRHARRHGRLLRRQRPGHRERHGARRDVVPLHGARTAPRSRRRTSSSRVVVPRDRIFVMGDHRDLSADSRCHLSDVSTQGRGQTAFVPVSDVVGPAFAIVSPFDRAKRLRIPATFADVPAPTEAAPERGEIKPAGVSC